MTVTKRKQKPRDTGGADAVATAPALESGMKASCDSCSADITHTVRVRCAEPFLPGAERLMCPDFDLCVPCFLAGKQVGPHRANHAYRIISSHAFPIFTKDWGADEELSLIEGAEMYGLGNWADMAEHVGGRTKEECQEHYMKTYIWSKNFPLPEIEANFDADQENFSQRKKARLEELRSRPLQQPPPKPLASAPTCHEIGGYMPARLEFEHEYENDAETLVKDLEFGKVYQFGGDDQPAAPPVVPPAPDPHTKKKVEEDEKPAEVEDEPLADLELKLTILEMFNQKYDKRIQSKELLFDRGLMNYKQIAAVERRRTKDERDLISRAKVFARIQTAQDHENFVDGLIYEHTLRRRIAELQEYRKMGVTTLSESERYEHAKQQRISSKAAAYRDSLSISFDRFQNRSTSRQPNLKPFHAAGGNQRPNSGQLTLATANSLHLLTKLEQELCSTLRILPKPYLYLKETLLREFTRLNGKMGLHHVTRLVSKMTPSGELIVPEGEWVEKLERVFEFLVDTGGLRPPAETMTNGGTEHTERNVQSNGMDVDQASSGEPPVAISQDS